MPGVTPTMKHIASTYRNWYRERHIEYPKFIRFYWGVMFGFWFGRFRDTHPPDQDPHNNNPANQHTPQQTTETGSRSTTTSTTTPAWAEDCQTHAATSAEEENLTAATSRRLSS